MHNIHHTANQSSTYTELRLANIKFKSQVLLKVALQKIPPMVPATIKSTSKSNHVLAININRNIPCTHTFALILRLNYLFPLVLLPQFCSVQTWQNIYSSNFHPIVFGPHVLRTTTRTSYRLRGRTCMQCLSHSHTSGES